MRYGNGYDYTVVFFTSDLPDTITPMEVMAWSGVPGTYGALLRTCQANYVSANMPPFAFSDPSKPPFNDYNTHQGGDSGSPWMIPMTDGLVYVSGAGLPSCQMQCDMDALSQWWGLRSPYPKMQWYGSSSDPCASYQCPPLDQCLK